MVTKAPLYEDGVLVGVISVSSEAAKFNTIDSEFQRTCQSGASGQPGVQKLNSKGNQWPLRPLIAPMPQIASSVSNLVLTNVIISSLYLYFFFLTLFYLDFSGHLQKLYHNLVFFSPRHQKFFQTGIWMIQFPGILQQMQMMKN